MGELLTELQKCRVFTPGCSPLAIAVVELVRVAYGGPTRSVTSCPPGDEPPQPKDIWAMVQLMPELVFETEDRREDVQIYILEEYEAALTAWTARTAFCAQTALPKKDKAKGGKTPGTTEQPTRAEGIVIILGIGVLLVAGRLAARKYL